ncbi:hypothetical protein AX16_005351 [Volvariella volvacea WC 439]|nr:hypothetical protein AX16_005351 [Volvariella volvacea WC 439]
MVSVGLVGASSGIGDSIARAILANPTHTLTIFSRSPQPHFESLGAKVVIINDHSDLSLLTTSLSNANIHTLISTLITPHDPSIMFNVLRAAKAAGVKRFAPSEFALRQEANELFDLYAPKVELWEEARSSGMQITAFRNGLFMDYFAFGSPVKHEGPLKLFPLYVDIEKRSAAIPGDGNQKVTFTRVEDIGKFVESVVSFDEHTQPWFEDSGMAGDELTYNEVIAEAERIVGEKFDVRYVDEEGLKKEIESYTQSGDVGKKFLSQVGLAIARGLGTVEPTLHGVANVKPVKVKELLEKYWGHGDSS